MTEKLILLKKLYDTISWLEKEIFSCRKGCSTCCTQSVTLSSLEGQAIYCYLKKNPAFKELIKLIIAPGTKPYRPKMTTNKFARLCLQKKDIYADNGSWSFSPCVFLEKGACLIYEVRPFSCRAFVSLSDCRKKGSASMPPVIITLNTMIHQIIEHLSVGSWWGNLMDIIPKTLMEEGIIEMSAMQREIILQDPEKIPGFLLEEKELPIVAKNFAPIKEILHSFAEGELQDDINHILRFLP